MGTRRMHGRGRGRSHSRSRSSQAQVVGAGGGGDDKLTTIRREYASRNDRINAVATSSRSSSDGGCERKEKRVKKCFGEMFPVPEV